ncbi:hypothetical protein [Epilithonimonas caeni]|uniref:hypothetical protein n=1 Tax=Epilithonimonas caeni TaxID=365343 RepID=UPI0004042736|nr:hypothetical protein [Epilithonimonas caeni]
MKITKQLMENAYQLIGKTKEEIYTLLGTPDYLELEGTQLIYIIRNWFRRNALILELDTDDTVESAEPVYDIEISKAG